MHIEIQVALNFVISYLYNKLPRRRVNLFGEELDKALKLKFDGHWYPEKPFKGSAYRCLRVGSPLDPVIENAARESGVDLSDIREHLPDELSIWIDPGEVSYRIGEKGSVKILYSDECSSLSPTSSADDDVVKEIGRSFNPEAQCFKPIESVTATIGALSVTSSSNNNGVTVTLSNSNKNNNNNGDSPTFNNSSSNYINNSPSSPNSFKNINNNSLHNNNNLNNLNNNVAGGKQVAPLTFTTATFAQTKFGSTKLKSSSKRSNRMSPTEFSNYIKQRAIMQQQQQQSNGSMFPSPSSPQPQRPRSLSPINMLSPADHFVFMGGHHHHQQQQQQQQFGGLFDNSYLRDLIVVSNGSNSPSSQQPQHLGGGASTKFGADNANSTGANSTTNNVTASAAAETASSSASPFLMTGINDNSKSLLDGINFNLNNMPYSSQHLLVAN